MCVCVFVPLFQDRGSMLGSGKAGTEGQNFRPPVAMASSMSTNGGTAGHTFDVVSWCGALLLRVVRGRGQRSD